MEKELLEAFIHRMDRGRRVECVLAVAEDLAVEPGENFTSTIHRIRAHVRNGAATALNKTFILKRAPSSGHHTQLFQAETKVYNTVLKEMEYLIEDFEDTEEPHWCQLIHYEPYTSLLLEDLQGSGYKMVNRRVGMDLEHGLLAIRALGRYHGLAKILEERGVISKDDFRPYHGKAKDVVQTITYNAVQNMINGIRNWGPEWNDIAAKLNLPVEEFYQNVCKSLKEEESEFQVLNHGDCWSNNIMFKYDWAKKPVSVRFIDFQSPHHSTPLMDVSNFLYFSMQPSIRRYNYNSLLENYHESLTSTLTKYGYRGTKPNTANFFKIMDRLSYFWVYIYASWYPMLTAETKDTPDLAIIIQTSGKKGFRTEIYEERRVREQLGPDLEHLAQKNIT